MQKKQFSKKMLNLAKNAKLSKKMLNLAFFAKFV
jgi:hypothetical protein